MIKLCLMASHGYPPGVVLHQDQCLSRIIKDPPPYLASHGTRQEVVTSGFANLMPKHYEELWKPVPSLCNCNQFVINDLAIKRPTLSDVQEACPDSILFSSGIAEQCTRQEKILKYLISESGDLERGGVDLSLLSELIGLHGELIFDDHQQQPYAPFLIYPGGEFDAPKPLLDFVGDMARSSKITVHPNGQVLFTGSKAEIRDILSLVAEFYLSQNSEKRGKHSMLVPQFSRVDITEAEANMCVSYPKTEAVTVAPLKSPEKVKVKAAPKKKKGKKGVKERDLYKKNYFHACESLLCLMLDKSQYRKTAILSLKKSGPELPELLAQFSSGIAGTGLAVLFSVICKVACGRMAFSASKLLNTGIGFGLVWLSWAVNKLRDTIVHLNKNGTKLNLKEDEMMRRVDESMKQIYFGAATLMTVAVLRLV